ncbi:MAG: hypothetical protein ABI644_07395 [Arenimonas sp.]
MPNKKDKIDVLVSIGPHMGLIFGFVLGLIVACYSGDPPKNLVGVYIRAYSVFASLTFWTLFTVLPQRKEIYGGGSVDVTDDRLPRLRLISIMMFSAFLFAGFFLVAKDIYWSMGISLVALYLFGYELVYGNVEYIGRTIQEDDDEE